MNHQRLKKRSILSINRFSTLISEAYQNTQRRKTLKINTAIPRKKTDKRIHLDDTAQTLGRAPQRDTHQSSLAITQFKKIKSE